MRGYTYLSVLWHSKSTICFYTRGYTSWCVVIHIFFILQRRYAPFSAPRHSHFTKCGYTRGYTLNAWLYTFISTPAFHSTIYGYIHGYASRCAVIRIFLHYRRRYTPFSILRHSYSTTCSYTRGYTLWCVVIPVIRPCNHIIYMYSIVPYTVNLFQHHPLCFVTAFSKYVSTLFFIRTYGHIA